MNTELMFHLLREILMPPPVWALLRASRPTWLALLLVNAALFAGLWWLNGRPTFLWTPLILAIWLLWLPRVLQLHRDAHWQHLPSIDKVVARLRFRLVALGMIAVALDINAGFVRSLLLAIIVSPLVVRMICFVLTLKVDDAWTIILIVIAGAVTALNDAQNEGVIHVANALKVLALPVGILLLCCTGGPVNRAWRRYVQAAATDRPTNLGDRPLVQCILDVITRRHELPLTSWRQKDELLLGDPTKSENDMPTPAQPLAAIGRCIGSPFGPLNRKSPALLCMYTALIAIIVSLLWLTGLMHEPKALLDMLPVFELFPLFLLPFMVWAYFDRLQRFLQGSSTVAELALLPSLGGPKRLRMLLLRALAWPIGRDLGCVIGLLLMGLAMRLAFLDESLPQDRLILLVSLLALIPMLWLCALAQWLYSRLADVRVTLTFSTTLLYAAVLAWCGVNVGVWSAAVVVGLPCLGIAMLLLRYFRQPSAFVRC